jgi:hypothetical protein
MAHGDRSSHATVPDRALLGCDDGAGAQQVSGRLAVLQNGALNLNSHTTV